MAKVLSCRDVGVECDFTARAETMEELFEKMKAHAKSDHNMEEVPEEMVAKLMAAVRDE